MDRCCFYLKINRQEGYTIRNLKRWLMIVKQKGSDCFILCDDSTLKDRVEKDCSIEIEELKELGLKIDFMESDRSDGRSVEIVGCISDAFWRNAAFAHLTTFLHAYKQNYDCFWNIDADDTKFLLNIPRCAELLDEVEKQAKISAFSALSLDMWASRLGDGGWSFGVSFIQNIVDWFSIMLKHANEYPEEKKYNIDKFFRYIKKQTPSLKIDTFYAENLKFLHYSNDFLWRAWESGLYHWKNGHLYMPILLNEFGLADAGDMQIVKGAVKIDIGIKDSESQEELVKGCKNPEFFSDAPGKI